MELDQQLKDLSQKYLFESTQYQTDGQSPNLEVCLQLRESHIDTFIQKAGQLNSLVESCANMVGIFDTAAAKEEMLKTTIRCSGRDKLFIRTTPSMMKILVETLFD
ncbi:hypothetical protein BXY41_10548 [Lacrimispora xylanisolvens]|uniref:Uncharacterized protein n=1 Tax=Lacrimispora xylanisolvens TaxID=384636 RepID=A0A2S6HSW1_9FIRM|nr:hypothetical protein [Hungatella xylanolytica]PPK80833.1 hypothetical protein BXY41_10548 [Hungatella xylanolytica]